jgi:hypothetical protein
VDVYEGACSLVAAFLLIVGCTQFLGIVKVGTRFPLLKKWPPRRVRLGVDDAPVGQANLDPVSLTWTRTPVAFAETS